MSPYLFKYRLLQLNAVPTQSEKSALSYLFKYRLLQREKRVLLLEGLLLSYLFKYRLLQLANNLGNTYTFPSCHTYSNTGFYNFGGYALNAKGAVVIPIQIQASTTRKRHQLQILSYSCHTYSNTGFYNSYQYGFNSHYDSCHTYSNTGFYNQREGCR